jgi:hypothetical protein
MNHCLRVGGKFGEGQSCRICFPEFTYGKRGWCDSRVFEVPLPPKQLQELYNNFRHIVLFLKTPSFRITLLNIRILNDM